MNPQAPESLIHQGRLALHDIFKTAKLNERESALVKGRVANNFPAVIPNDPWYKSFDTTDKNFLMSLTTKCE